MKEVDNSFICYGEHYDDLVRGQGFYIGYFWSRGMEPYPDEGFTQYLDGPAMIEAILGEIWEKLSEKEKPLTMSEVINHNQKYG